MKTQPEANGHGKPIIFQIVGYQNSGKTTLITKLITRLTKGNWNVSTLKHHGHGGQPDTKKNKDTSHHIAAGAVASLVEGGGRVIVQADQQELSLAQQIQLISFFKMDFLLIEGHKHEKFPKAVLVRDKEDYELIRTLTNVVVVFYWDEKIIADEDGIPHFQINDEQGLLLMENYLLTAQLKSHSE